MAQVGCTLASSGTVSLSNWISVNRVRKFMFWISGVLKILNWTLLTLWSFQEEIQKSRQTNACSKWVRKFECFEFPAFWEFSIEQCQLIRVFTKEFKKVNKLKCVLAIKSVILRKKKKNRADVGVDLKLLGCWPIRRDVITMAVQKFECVKFAISVRVNNFETAKIRAIL